MNFGATRILAQMLKRQASAAMCPYSHLGKLYFTVFRNVSPVLRQRALQSPKARFLYHSLVPSTPQSVCHRPRTCTITQVPWRILRYTYLRWSLHKVVPRNKSIDRVANPTLSRRRYILKVFCSPTYTMTRPFVRRYHICVLYTQRQTSTRDQTPLQVFPTLYRWCPSVKMIRSRIVFILELHSFTSVEFPNSGGKLDFCLLISPRLDVILS